MVKLLNNKVSFDKINHKNAKKNLVKMSFLPQKWPKRFAYTQLTYLVSYLDGNVKQKQTQNTTNHSDSTMDEKR